MPLALRLEPDIIERAGALADQCGYKRSVLMEQFIRAGLDMVYAKTPETPRCIQICRYVIGLEKELK
jgi:predicted transcriptional regulator